LYLPAFSAIPWQRFQKYAICRSCSSLCQGLYLRLRLRLRPWSRLGLWPSLGL
jgi:hypothetical protein